MSDGVRGYGELPAAWRFALRDCPHCVTGSLEAKAACVFCKGTGDLLATMLKDAYLQGRRDVADAFREVAEVRRLALLRVREQEPTPAELRRQLLGG